MGFWIFMLICNLLIPFTMIGIGKHFSKSAPKEINTVFGYRTAMSMKNKDTWSFAHHYCGKLWWLLGWILFAVTIIGMVFLFGKPENIVGTFGGIICGMQLVFLVGYIFPIEVALKKTFDEKVLVGHKQTTCSQSFSPVLEGILLIAKLLKSEWWQ